MNSFRKSVLQHRIALATVWPLAFPAHDFVSLRLIRSQVEPITPWPNEEAWRQAARAYHAERREKERMR